MILVNAGNVLKGGGVNVVLSFLSFLNNSNECFIVILPKSKVYSDYCDGKIGMRVIWAPVGKIRYIYKLFFSFIVNIYIIRYGVNKVYSLGNIAVMSRVKQVVLVQNAFSTLQDRLVWNKFKFFDRMYLKVMQFLILNNLRYANHIIVQTETEKTSLIKLRRICPKKISVVPNSINFELFQNNAIDSSVLKETKGLRLIFLSKYYPHKNFEILEELSKEIIKKKLPITISLTLDPKDSKENKILKKLSIYDTVISNYGSVFYKDLPFVYSNHDGVFLPTLLESFSGNYIEAMYFSKMIFTSDRDFSREVCGDCAFYFEPLSVKSIIDTFLIYLNDNKIESRKLQNYKEQLSKLQIFNSSLTNQKILNSI